jgi:glycerate-2-kinase
LPGCLQPRLGHAGGLDPAAFFADNDFTGYFNGIGELFPPGTTFTNITVVGTIVVDTPSD